MEVEKFSINLVKDMACGERMRIVLPGRAEVESAKSGLYKWGYKQDPIRRFSARMEGQHILNIERTR